MPRAFTAVEKEAIRDRLMEAGHACFLRYGLKKTTIEDLTKPAGIAKASFYLFFDSSYFLRDSPAKYFYCTFFISSIRSSSRVYRTVTIANDYYIRAYEGIYLQVQSEQQRHAIHNSLEFLARYVKLVVLLTTYG